MALYMFLPKHAAIIEVSPVLLIAISKCCLSICAQYLCCFCELVLCICVLCMFEDIVFCNALVVTTHTDDLRDVLRGSTKLSASVTFIMDCCGCCCDKLIPAVLCCAVLCCAGLGPI